MNELLPCPFCGGGSTDRGDYRGGEWSHDAPDCFLNGVFISGQHSIEQWNTRARSGEHLSPTDTGGGK